MTVDLLKEEDLWISFHPQNNLVIVNMIHLLEDRVLCRIIRFDGLNLGYFAWLGGQIIFGLLLSIFVNYDL